MSSTLTNSCQVTYEIKAQCWTQQFSDECSMETYETMNIQMQHDNFIVRFGCMEVRSGRRTRANVSPLRLKSKPPNAELSKACEGVIPRIRRLWEIPESRIQIPSGSATCSLSLQLSTSPNTWNERAKNPQKWICSTNVRILYSTHDLQRRSRSSRNITQCSITNGTIPTMSDPFGITVGTIPFIFENAEEDIIQFTQIKYRVEPRRFPTSTISDVQLVSPPQSHLDRIKCWQ